MLVGKLLMYEKLTEYKSHHYTVYIVHFIIKSHQDELMFQHLIPWLKILIYFSVKQVK